MAVIQQRMPSGIAGDVSRKAGCILEPGVMGADARHGSPLQLNAKGEYVPVFDQAKPVHGFLVRFFPSQGGDEPGAGTAKAGTVQDAMRSGYMTVRVSSAESAALVKGTPVKVVFAVAGSFAVGDIAASSGVAVPGCIFMGPADADRNAEIAFNI